VARNVCMLCRRSIDSGVPILDQEPGDSHGLCKTCATLYYRSLGDRPDDKSSLDLFVNFWFGGDSEGFDKFKSIDPDELRRGIKHEREHSPDEVVAAKIAIDHLVKHKDYYDRLERAGL